MKHDALKTVLGDPGKRAFSLMDEFRNFAFKGNVIDLSVGVVIGSAFGKLIDSLVKQLLMPTIGLLMPSKQGYLGWKLVLGEKEVPYGLFIGEVVNFLIVSFVIFIFIVKFLGWVMKIRQEKTVAAAPALTRTEELLIEIRDALKEK